ncbi:MAG: RNA pseudouridine synthase [Elusimicrobia bacterium]|nr:RNA pseudouridine synthase [Elusimicrobiota bacterium]
MIVFEDENILVADKPAGLLVIPGRGPAKNEQTLKGMLSEEAGRLWVVHRLDREASGLVCFARNAQTHRYLSMKFEQREVKKTYLVLVQGVLSRERDAIQSKIRTYGSGRMGVHPDGKESETKYRVKERFVQASLCEVDLMTGRRHQIRVHFYSIGHPVAGDPLYGSRPEKSLRLMLHAWKLAFRGPDGKPIDLEVAPPPDFLSVVESLRTRSVQP